MWNTNLINKIQFKQYSPLKLDSMEVFMPYISIAQELYITPVLGDSLMKKLKEQVSRGSVQYHIKEMIEQIAPALANYAVYQGLPFHWASIINQNVQIRDNETSKGLDRHDVAQLRRWIKDDADLHLEKLSEYLTAKETHND